MRLREVDIVKLNAAGGHPILGWTVILLLRMDRGDTHGPAPTGTPAAAAKT